MLNHPMLQMREPPPEIDVTKPALPKRGPDFPPVVLDFALTDEQMREFSLDPWSIFEKIPEARKFLSPDPEREAPADGWIEWKGGKSDADPVNAEVFIRFRDGSECLVPTKADRLYWGHDNNLSDIIAYRVCK